MNKVLKFGIAPLPVQRARTIAIAAGTRQRAKDEPTVWFPAVTAMTRVLSDENMVLLKVIRERPPGSMDALATAVGAGMNVYEFRNGNTETTRNFLDNDDQPSPCK